MPKLCFAAGTFTLCGVVGFLAPVWAMDGPGSDTKPAAAANPIAAGMMARGVQQCAPTIQERSAYFQAPKSKVGAFLFTDAHETANKTLASASMEISYPAGVSSYASASFMPTADGRCATVNDAVSWWPGTCEDVRALAFKTYREAGKLGQRIVVLQHQGSTRVFLLPTNEGCVTIQKDITF